MDELLKWGINLNSVIVIVIGFLLKKYINSIELVLHEIRGDVKEASASFMNHRLDDEARFSKLEALIEKNK